MRKGADPSTRNLENEQPVHLVPDGPVGEQVSATEGAFGLKHLPLDEVVQGRGQLVVFTCALSVSVFHSAFVATLESIALFLTEEEES